MDLDHLIRRAWHFIRPEGGGSPIPPTNRVHSRTFVNSPDHPRTLVDGTAERALVTYSRMVMPLTNSPTPRRRGSRARHLRRRASWEDIPHSLPSRKSRTREEKLIPPESSIRCDGSSRKKHPHAVVVVVLLLVMLVVVFRWEWKRMRKLRSDGPAKSNEQNAGAN